MAKQRVVYDTMIWYNISTGLIPKNRCENFELISTYLNIYEILTSNYLLSEPERTFKVLSTLMTESDTKYLNPFQYFDEKTNERFNKNIKDIQIEFVKKLVSGALEYKINIESNQFNQLNYALATLASRDMCKMVAYLEKIDYVKPGF